MLRARRALGGGICLFLGGALFFLLPFRWVCARVPCIDDKPGWWVRAEKAGFD